MEHGRTKRSYFIERREYSVLSGLWLYWRYCRWFRSGEGARGEREERSSKHEIEIRERIDIKSSWPL
jgi:hypothetical protein